MNSQQRSSRKNKKKEGAKSTPSLDCTFTDFSLLPCIRHGEIRWWLPCDPQTSLLLAELLISCDRTSVRRVPSSLHRRLRDALQTSPPLFLFCAIQLTSHREVKSEYCLDDLVNWLELHFMECLDHGESYLGSPNITEAMKKDWVKLYQQFQQIPIKKWPKNAPRWLELHGSDVPKNLKKNWAGFVIDSAPTTESSVSPETYQNGGHPFLEKLSKQIHQANDISFNFEQQLKSSKTKAIKELAYGLSHEINNPLANISARAQQLQRDEQDEHRIASLKRISDQVYRAHEMIADLMFYANPPAIKLEDVDLCLLLRDVVDRYQNEAERKSIEISIAVTSETDNAKDNSVEPHVDIKSQLTSLVASVDGSMVGEAIGALLRNSIEAISDCGRIQVSITRAKESVAIEVADSGPGLSEKAKEHAFDPYFSGREAGRGLGLGLCRVARIAELHDGTVEIRSNIVGCIVKMLLPH